VCRCLIGCLRAKADHDLPVIPISTEQDQWKMYSFALRLCVPLLAAVYSAFEVTFVTSVRCSAVQKYCYLFTYLQVPESVGAIAVGAYKAHRRIIKIISTCHLYRWRSYLVQHMPPQREKIVIRFVGANYSVLRFGG